jgi:hypothetical protein
MNVSPDFDADYMRAVGLMRSIPDLSMTEDPETLMWLGRCQAQIEKFQGPFDVVQFRDATAQLANRAMHAGARRVILTILYRLVATLEAKASPNAGGAFISAGSTFDAFTALSKPLGEAISDVLVADPYVDDVFLRDFAGCIKPGVTIRLLADREYLQKNLRPAATRWAEQNGAAHPLEVRVTPRRKLHDRLIIVDQKVVWLVSQSFKDLAARAHASIVRADDIADLKIYAYAEHWAEARPLEEV